MQSKEEKKANYTAFSYSPRQPGRVSFKSVVPVSLISTTYKNIGRILRCTAQALVDIYSVYGAGGLKSGRRSAIWISLVNVHRQEESELILLLISLVMNLYSDAYCLYIHFITKHCSLSWFALPKLADQRSFN